MGRKLAISGFLFLLALGGSSVCYFFYIRDPSLLIGGGAIAISSFSFLPK